MIGLCLCHDAFNNGSEFHNVKSSTRSIALGLHEFRALAQGMEIRYFIGLRHTIFYPRLK